MGKRRDCENDSADNSGSASKHHKRHKKHKTRRIEYESDVADVDDSSLQTPTKDSTMPQQTDADKLRAQTGNLVKTSPTNPKQQQKKKRTKGKDSETSSDEERWLTAIETGKLDEVDDELKKIKDPKLMTARQRAMYERGSDKEIIPGVETLMSLPTGYKEKVMTAEAIQKAQLKSQKRKQLADEKREKDKKKTMERLLKKQETKTGKQGRLRMAKAAQPVISYKNTLNGATISLPPSVEFPLIAQKERSPPKIVLCSISDCKNLKVYNCSKTNVPLCSFKCYRRNADLISN